MQLTFRSAHTSDAGALLQMNAAFNGDTGVTEEAICRSLSRSPEIVVIAEADGTPAGFCCAQVHHSFCYPSPVAEVTEMYVAEPFRRMGCASGMLRFLEAHVTACYGVDELHLLTGCSNTAAQAAYQRAGFTPHPEVYLSKPLK